MEKIIEVYNLKKSYGEVNAVRGVSFYAEAGKLFAFLGPNGAGKSTTIDILCSILPFDEGEVSICGHTLGSEDAAIRQNIGVVFQHSVLDSLLTVRQNLVYRAGLYFTDKEKILQAVRNAALATDVMEFIDRPYGKLSGGQRRRADIARALVSTPKILFLDEPTTGLDPQMRKNVWNLIQHLKDEDGMTIFLTTHYMEEAAGSDYVVVIDDGLITAEGTPAELKSRYAQDILRLSSRDEEALRVSLAGTGYDYRTDNGQMAVKLPSTMSALPILDKCRDYISGFEVAQGTMDDVFLQITGKEIRE